MFSLIVSGSGKQFSEPLPWSITASRFLEQSCEEAISLFQGRKNLDQLDSLPAIVTGEWGADTDQVVRYGFVKNVQRSGNQLQFSFKEKAHGPQDVLDDFKRDLQLGRWENSRTHWAIKQGDLPAEFMASLSRGAFKEFPYEIVITYASENSEYVNEVAEVLTEQGIKIFYAPFEQSELWGQSLKKRLDVIYQNLGRYCLMFVSVHYARKVWPNFEKKAAIRRAIRQNDGYILACRFDDTELPGLANDVVYQDLRTIGPEELAELTIGKLRRRRR